jgi:2,4-dienoyl-CoA reductase-like NADH-dependent reductase (Old Yellow Enzyme family)
MWGMARLFAPLDLRSLTLSNRIQVSPMCQYSAVDGAAGDWHLMHLGSLALSGAGLLVIEATAVVPEGRITPHCLELSTDVQAEALAHVRRFCGAHAPIAVGVQLAHAGRKASAQRPWDGGRPVSPADGGWEVIGPSAVPYTSGWPTPREMSRDDLRDVREAFVAATRRADAAGIDLVEVHAAHGYLLSTFLSPFSNVRTDEYGGSRANRMRFPLEVFEAMRRAWPTHKPMGVRIHGSDWVEGGWTVDDAAAFAGALKALGCDYVTVSSGGVISKAPITAGPGYQVPLAAAVRRATGMPTCAVGLITTGAQAEAILAEGSADQVAIARAMLFNPHWAWQAAADLGADYVTPPQYERATPRMWPGARRA